LKSAAVQFWLAPDSAGLAAFSSPVPLAQLLALAQVPLEAL
jgi:hypothetical protein